MEDIPKVFMLQEDGHKQKKILKWGKNKNLLENILFSFYPLSLVFKIRPLKNNFKLNNQTSTNFHQR